MDGYIEDHTCIITASLIPRPHPAILKGIRAGVGFGSGTETKLLLPSYCFSQFFKPRYRTCESTNMVNTAQ